MQALGMTDSAEMEVFLDELLGKEMEENHIAGTAVAAAVRQALQNSAGETVCVRIYMSSLKRADLEEKQSWGFFMVEKPTAHGESLAYIELFLFAEGDV